jgi:RHS repeat-associated protein
VEDNQNETGTLDDFMYRRYSTTQGRWISPDPAGLAAVDPTNPQTWNRYAYVTNQPLSFTDPLGLFGYCPPVDGPYIPGGVNADGTTNCDTPVCPGFGYSIIDGYFVCGSPTQIAAAEQGCASGNNGNCPSGGQTGGGGGPAGPPTPLTPQQIKELAGGPGFYSADIGTTIGCPVPSRFVRRGGYHGRRQRSGYATRS